MMPEPQNDKLVKQVIRAIIDVVSRRTSEGYATISVGTVIKKIEQKYAFLKYISIKSTQYAEALQLLTVQSDINQIEFQTIGKALEEIIGELTNSIGKAADFYFLRELKEEIGYNYELILKNVGVDLDFMQFQYLVDRKEVGPVRIEQADVLKKVTQVLFDIITEKTSRMDALKTTSGLIIRLSTRYPFFKQISINDIRFTQGTDVATIPDEINDVERAQFSEALNRLFSEVNKEYGEKENSGLFIERLKGRLRSLMS